MKIGTCKIVGKWEVQYLLSWHCKYKVSIRHGALILAWGWKRFSIGRREWSNA